MDFVNFTFLHPTRTGVQLYVHEDARLFVLFGQHFNTFIILFYHWFSFTILTTNFHMIVTRPIIQVIQTFAFISHGSRVTISVIFLACQNRQQTLAWLVHAFTTIVTAHTLSSFVFNVLSCDYK